MTKVGHLGVGVAQWLRLSLALVSGIKKVKNGHFRLFATSRVVVCCLGALWMQRLLASALQRYRIVAGGVCLGRPSSALPLLPARFAAHTLPRRRKMPSPDAIKAEVSSPSVHSRQTCPALSSDCW